MKVRVYPNWLDDPEGRAWSFDFGDHRTQERVRAVRMLGVTARDGVDPTWSRQEARDADAPKMWLEVNCSFVEVVCGVAVISGPPEAG